MKHLAPHDRPREKFERLCAAALGDNELLAIVLGSGSRDAGALALANQLLAHADGVFGLTRVDLAELQQVPGVGPARAAQVLAAVELGRRTLTRGPLARPQLKSPRELAEHLLPQYGASPVEQFGLVMLDSKLHIVRIKVITIGSLDSAVAHPREVFREAAVASAIRRRARPISNSPNACSTPATSWASRWSITSSCRRTSTSACRKPGSSR
jgi:DNA repair protein RadC